MLENMFPRHVLEYIMGAAGPDATLGELAYQHDQVGGFTPGRGVEHDQLGG